ncbi:MAG: hypothetical protein A4E73_00763 [Syntrophaceae bacterium PtaU1.Bin231]|nr:MAG: hypothetical protein A4E73_00763 [Syntrophaceae bacterium PtaU1.Bin231]HOG17036.1 hypothetical protein [Syntrophales bacterium]
MIDLTKKPFTKALLLRASLCQGGAGNGLKEKLGRTKPIIRAKTLNESAARCAVAVAGQITAEAMKNTRLGAKFLPRVTPPDHAPIAVAYSLCILSAVHSHLQEEGVHLDFKQMSTDTANRFFARHPDGERAKNARDGIRTFRTVTRAYKDHFRNWHDQLMLLIPLYLFQWTTTNPELKKYDFIPLFGNILSSFLKAVQ